MTDARTAAETLVAGFGSAWNAHDMAAFATLFHPDATFVNRFGAYWRGRDRVVAEHATIHAGIFRESAFTVIRVEDVDPIGADAAVVHMSSTLSVGAAMPHGPREVDTRMLLVITREDDAWRITAGENVTIAPPPAPLAPASQAGS